MEGRPGSSPKGPADILVRDCTFGPASPAIWIDNGQAARPVPVDVRLRHSTLMAGAGPVFEFEGSLARFLVDDCVVAPAGTGPPDAGRHRQPPEPDMAWTLQPLCQDARLSRDDEQVEGAEVIDDFGRWKESPTEVREVGSVLASTSVWRSAHALQDLLLDQENPTPGVPARDAPT